MTQKNETSSKIPQPRKVFDVARPGSARPTTSSRPIITTNRSVQDPMVTRDDDRAATVDAEVSNTSSTGPSTAPPLPGDAAADASTSQNAPKVPVSSPDTDTEIETVPVKKSEPETPDSEVSVPEKPTALPPTSATPAEPAEKPAQDVDALIHDDDLETRVLHDLKDVTYEESQPTEVEQPHLGHVIVVSAIILLIVILICLDILLDAGAITIPGLPHTQFINTYQP